MQQFTGEVGLVTFTKNAYVLYEMLMNSYIRSALNSI